MDLTAGLLLIVIAICVLAVAGVVPLLLFGRVLSRDPKHYELIVYNARKALEAGDAVLALRQIEAGLVRLRGVTNRSGELAQCEVELLLCQADCLVTQKKHVEALSAMTIAAEQVRVPPMYHRPLRTGGHGAELRFP